MKPQTPLSQNSQIMVWNRRTGRAEAEQVYGDSALQWTYGTKPGQLLVESVLSKHFISQVYGAYQSSRLSRHKVNPFIEDFKIPMAEFEEKDFTSFNDFFIRKFRQGARTFVSDRKRLPAFAEARYFAYEKITPDQTIPVKGTAMTATLLLGEPERAEFFEGGPLLLARLCPTDYHRFHFPDGGTVSAHFVIPGKLHSVNPKALKYKDDIFSTNERHVSILETENFGKLAYIEVGALCVGKIVQTHPVSQPYSRGDEKGYFLFGGSTVIVIGEPGRWKPDADLLEQTRLGRESLVRLGEAVAG